MLAGFFSIVAASSIFLLAAAAPGGQGHNGGSNQVSQCNGGSVMCCSQTQKASSVDKRTSLILELVGLDNSNLQGLVGSNCSPITAIGVGSGGSWLVLFPSCWLLDSSLMLCNFPSSTQQVCCQQNFNSTTRFLQELLMFMS